MSWMMDRLSPTGRIATSRRRMGLQAASVTCRLIEGEKTVRGWPSLLNGPHCLIRLPLGRTGRRRWIQKGLCGRDEV